MRLAVAGVIVLLASPLVSWQALGYDGLRLPVVAVGAALVAAGGAVAAWPAPSRAWVVAAGVYLAAHAASVIIATNRGAALDALVPVVGGLAIGWAVARGVARELVIPVLLGVGLVAAAWAFAQDVPVGPFGNKNYTGGFGAILAAVSLATALFAG